MVGSCFRTWTVAVGVAVALGSGTLAAGTPAVGEKASDFTLSTADGTQVRLHDRTAKSPVALVVLRGYPGYQCPVCSRQVGDLIANAKRIAEARGQVVLVYPGPGAKLTEHGREFLKRLELPANMTLVLDPDYRFTERYGLRWNAPNETAYPSTFVLDTRGVVRYANVSKNHGGRVPAAEVVKVLASLR